MSDDGLDIEGGRYEAWVRGLAAFGCVEVVVCGVFFAAYLPRAFERASWVAAIAVACLFLFVVGGSGLAARARGRRVRWLRNRHRNQIWVDWVVVMIFILNRDWMGSDDFTPRVAVVLASIILPLIAWRLDALGHRPARA